MVIQHWVLLTSCWRFPNRSLVKAVQTVRSYALLVATALAGLLALTTVLDQIGRCLAAGCRMNPRQRHLNAYQLLLACA